jgi:ABC-type glutathione transport system ATPase component
MCAMTAPLVEVHDLVVRYKSRGLFAAPFKHAVNGVTLSLPAGSTLGLVGESGSGKSSLLRALLRLVPVESGTISLGGEDWLAIDGSALRRARHSIGFVAQNPFLSLSPRLTIAQILAEPLLARGDKPGAEMKDRIALLLSRCGLPANFLHLRASQLSGDQAQRVSIARALALSPRLLVLDEPTSALDVSVQAQILNLLLDLKADSGLSMLFVTHNLKVVAHLAEQLMVMRQGSVVEAGATERVMADPAQAYTRELIGFGRRR